MATLHVRNVPEDLYLRLRRRSESAQRSISAEVVTLLDQALAVETRSQGEILDGIRRRRVFRPAQGGAPESTVLLRQDRDR